MSENSMSEHELEQMRLALAQALFEEIDLNLSEALELADHFYREIATLLESGNGIELADFGYCSRSDGHSSINLYGTQRS